MRMIFEPRTERCPTCKGHGATYDNVPVGGEGMDFEPVSFTCDDCDEHGQIDAACIECETVTALNDDGKCRSCHKRSLTAQELAQFALDEAAASMRRAA